MKHNTMKVRVTRATDNNWYKVGEEYEVLKNLLPSGVGDYYPCAYDKNIGIGSEHCEIIEDVNTKFPFNVKCIDNCHAEHALCLGDIYTVTNEYFGADYILKGLNSSWSKSRFEIVQEPARTVEDVHRVAKHAIDSHYNFDYVLKESDIEAGKIKIDPYFVAKQWRTGERDPSGVIFHILKTCARFGEKNSKEREITAIYKSIKRLAELEGVKLE